MWSRTIVLTGILAIGVLPGGAAAEDKPSKISSYAGKYSGGLAFTDGTTTTGPSTAVFKTSRRKQKGSLVLSSTLFTSGSSIVFIERIDFKKRSAIYTLTRMTSGSSLTGGSTGSASIGRKTIRFSATFDFNAATLTVAGTIRRSGKQLAVSDIFTSGGSPVTLVYALEKKGR